MRHSLVRSCEKTCALYNRTKQQGLTELQTACFSNFQALLYAHFTDVWREGIYPDQWASSLMQPIYKGDGKEREDAASY